MISMSRRNKARNRPQSPRRRPDVKGKPMHHLSPIPLGQMIVPDGKCGRKMRYATEEKAQKALDQAQLSRRINNKLHAEKRYYSCDRCGGFHLTGREQYQNGRTDI